jgi:hypothetical protein
MTPGRIFIGARAAVCDWRMFRIFSGVFTVISALFGPRMPFDQGG